MVENERASDVGQKTAETAKKKFWQQPKVIQATIDQTEVNILAGPEIIIYVSASS
jgi:hypothetical protein